MIILSQSFANFIAVCDPSKVILRCTFLLSLKFVERVGMFWYWPFDDHIGFGLHYNDFFSQPSSLPLSFVYSAPGDCKVSLDGREYIGNISNTMSGRRCQRWDRQSPHAHNQDVAEYFPDLLLADAADRCRNPSNPFIVRSSWCYTMDPYQRREYCDIPFCLGMCGARYTLYWFLALI